MKKRLLAAMMSLCMIVSLLPVSALAVEDEGTVPVVEETVPLETTGTEAEIPQDVEIPDADNGISPMNISGPRSVEVGDTITLTSDNNSYWITWNHQWSSSDTDGKVKIRQDGNKAYITGVEAGTVRITHIYQYQGWTGSYTGSDSYVVTVTGGEPSHSDTDAYFYVLKPDYEGSAGTTEPRYFYYVGKGSVTDGSAEVDVANGVDDRITTKPTASVDAFNDLKLNGEEVFDYVGTDFENVTWYRVKKADGANGNNGTTIVGADKSCWHVDGMVNPQPPYYAVVFMMGDSIVQQYMIEAENSITNDQITYVTNMVNNDQSKPTDTHVEWYFDDEFTDPAPNVEIITKSDEMGEGQTLYIFGRYEKEVVETKYNITVKYVDDSTPAHTIKEPVALDGQYASGDYTFTVGKDAKFLETITTDGGDKYIYAASDKTVSVTVSGENAEITLVYTKDNWNATTGDETGGDGIADKYQALVKFESADESKGTVSGTGITQVFTFWDATDGYQTSGTITPTLNGVVTTANEGYAFDIWTKNEDTAAVNPESTINVAGGTTTTFKAHFEVDNLKDADKTADPGDTDSTTGGDGIPDKYQAKVTYTVEGGTWSENRTNTVTQVYTTAEKAANGDWTDQAVYLANIPDVTAVVPDSSHVKDGSWEEPAPTTSTVVEANKSYVFKYKLNATAPALSVTKTADKTSVAVGDSITYEVTIKNSGTGTLNNVIVTDTMWVEGKVTSVQVNGTETPLTKDETDGTYYYKIDRLEQDAPAVVITYTYPTKDADIGKLENTVTVTANEVPDGETDTPDTPVDVKDVFTVTFDSNGGSTVEPQEVVDGKTATRPADPTKEGYTFAGWTLNGESYDFTDPVTSDIELVAQWTDATRYTVTYNANNGTLIGASSVTVIPGRAVQLESSATRDGYIFMGWTTETILGQTYGVGASLPETIFQSGESFTPTGNTPLYAVWGEDRNHDDVADVYEVFIAPADITIYTGGTGYEGVSDGAGNEIENSNSGLPEPGFHIILPADLNMGFGEYLDDRVRFTYKGSDNLAGGVEVTREWTLSFVGTYSDQPRQYVYSLVSAEGTPAIRVTYTDPVSGAVLEDDDIGMTEDAAHGTYTMSINSGGLTPSAIQAVITTADGTPVTRSLVIGTGELTIRSTVDRTDNTNTIADNAGEVSDGSFNAVGNNASYVVNDSEVPVSTADDRVQLLVDQVSNSTAFNNAMGEAAVEKATVSGTAHETVYLDLVDTQNGNTVVTLDSGSMDIYWPMPSNADPYGDFQVVHYVDMNREVSASEGSLDTQETELLDGTAERINGDWYVRFTTRSFSPFVLVYEEDTSRPVNPNPGGGSGGDSDSDPTGNLSIELDVNGGDDEFTFTVILTDKDGDDLENNFYYNGDYTGTIGSGDEITLTGGDKIVIRNLPEGTRYEVIIETADGYTYVIDGEEGVIHTGMNEAEFTATRTVPVADPSVTGVSRWLNTTDHIAYLTGYPGGAFGPDNNMTRAEVAQMFYALLNNKNVTITKTFPDVPADAWYATAVNTLASLGMVSGDENGNYRPNDPITRAEFCVIALAFAYEPENAVCYFGDVSRSDWFYTYVAQAASYGWIGGYTNGNFGPNDRITRAQVTTIVNNMLGRAADRDYVIDHQADLVQFTDLTRAHWGYFQIMEATNAHDYTKSNGTENWR